MSVKSTISRILESVFLPFGILPYHRQRVEVDAIEGSGVPVVQDEYVVYRRISSPRRTFGDGELLVMRFTFDVSYYFAEDKDGERRKQALERLKVCKEAFLADPHFHIENDITDVSEVMEAPYGGFNVEFNYTGKEDYE